jgi:cytochrome P450
MDREAAVIWSPFTEGYFNNPYPHLKDCRENNPIHKGAQDSWMFFRHEDVSEILSSNKFLVSELSSFFKEKEQYIFKNSTACPYLSKGTKMWPLYLNGEGHKNIRVIMGKSLNLAGLEAELIDAVNIINDDHLNQKSFDLVNYCSRYIYRVLKKILGINGFDDLETIKTYSNMLARSQDIYVPKQVYLDINEWFLKGKNIFSDSEYKQNVIQHSKESGIDYTEDEVYSIMALTFMAAFETSKDNLSMAIFEILNNQELIDFVTICSTRELTTLIEELFRFSSPLQYTIRVNQEPLNYGGITIPANSRLYLSLASANRDSSVFDDPDQIVVDRNPNPHVSFGKGLHFCLGSNIAKMELRYCLKPMINFLKDYRVTGQAKWGKQIFMRTLESLKLEQIR